MTVCVNCGRSLGLKARFSGARLCARCLDAARMASVMKAEISRQLGSVYTPLSPEDELKQMKAEAARPNDGLELPGYPADTNGDCTCRWEIEDDGTQYTATWILDEEQPCRYVECQRRAKEWAPIIQMK